jgi:hypothetical protein
MRYEIYPALRLANGLSLEPAISDPDNFVQSLLDPNGRFQILGGNARKENAYYKTDYNNVAPSVGVAYTPNFESGIGKFLFGSEGKSVIRAGYSQVYGNDSIVTSINNAGVGNPGLGRTGLAFINLSDRIQNGVRTVPPPAITPRSRTTAVKATRPNSPSRLGSRNRSSW